MTTKSTTPVEPDPRELRVLRVYKKQVMLKTLELLSVLDFGNNVDFAEMTYTDLLGHAVNLLNAERVALKKDPIPEPAELTPSTPENDDDAPALSLE